MSDINTLNFHFTSLKIEDNLISDINNINQLSNEQLYKLIDLLFIFLSKQSNDPDTDTREYSNNNNINYKSLKSILNAYLFFLSHCLKKNMAASNVEEDLLTFGVDKEKANYIATQFGRKFIELSSTMIENTLKVNELVDMEWKFGVTAANSEVEKVGKVFLQLKLKVNRGDSIENVHMELTLNQFYSFLSELQKAQALM